MLQSDTDIRTKIIFLKVIYGVFVLMNAETFINQKDFLWERTSEPVLTRSKKKYIYIKVKTFLVFIARNMVILRFLGS